MKLEATGLFFLFVMSLRTCAVVFIGVFSLLSCAICAETDVSHVSPQCGLVSPLIKVRPPDTPPCALLSPPPLYTLSLARNEYESFQVICLGPLQGLDVTVALPPALAGIAPPPQLHSILYYTNAAGNVSDCNAKQGRWPDPLVPFTDVFVGEARNRTTAVPAAESRGFWVDFFVPSNTPSGTFGGGTVTVTAAGMLPLVLPYAATVYNFTLPQTSPWATAYGYLAHAHDPAPNASALAFADLALMHRFTIDNALTFAPQLNVLPPDFAGFLAVWGTFLTGRRLPFGLDNTTVTSFRLPSPFCYNFSASRCGDEALNATVTLWRALHDWASERGFDDLLFDYTQDEPQNVIGGWEELRARATAVHAASPALRVLSTLTMDNAVMHGVEDVVDLFVPLINDVAVKANCYTNAVTGAPGGDQRPLYNNVTLRNLWWYQACSSHGCHGGCSELSGSPSGEWYGHCETGWPSLMIDHSMVLNRVHPWATYLYNIGGELYWAISFIDSAGPAGDAWESQWTAGGNGDGTLSYRGTPARIGGDTEVPIASVRLKAIRDGQEDLLYMAAAEKVVGRDAVLRVIADVVTRGYAIADDPMILARTREALGALAEGGAGGDTSR